MNIQKETTDIHNSKQSKIMNTDELCEYINKEMKTNEMKTNEMKLNFRKDPRAELNFKIYIVNENEILAYSRYASYSIKYTHNTFAELDFGDIQNVRKDVIFQVMYYILKKDIGTVISPDIINEYGANLEIIDEFTYEILKGNSTIKNYYLIEDDLNVISDVVLKKINPIITVIE